ncbi:MAG: DUF3486 family protein [Burkholderiaceae bacterium]|nr:DUF3486 family protein [Burkholderiaceae bacterium]
MPPRSKVHALPKAVKQWLDTALVEGNFAGYEGLAEELKERGFDVSKTSVHRYGQAFEERLATLRLVTEQAKAVVEASPDDDDAVNQALIRVTQEKLFTVMMDLKIDPKQVDIAKITRSIADLSRSSTASKEYANKVKLRAKEAAKDIAAVAKKAGLTDEAVNEIKKRILGVA